MRTSSLFLGLLCGLSLLLITATWAQQSGHKEDSTSGSQSAPSPPSLPGTPPATASSPPEVLLSTATLLGRTVKNPQGEELGELDHLLIDPHTGRVMYAVITMGTILGMGGKTIQVSWETLQVVRDGQTLVLHTTQPLMPQASPGQGESPPAPAEPAR
jgi:sporulation protein YlmC with PRC-barrel domain